MLGAMAATGSVTAVVLWACGRQGKGSVAASGWPLAIGLGFATGAIALGFRPRTALAGDQERLLFLVVPLAVAVESWLAMHPRGTAGMLAARGGVALSVVPLLLLGSVYLTGGPGGWSPVERVCVSCGIGLAILAVWLALDTLERLRPDPAIALTLSATSLAAGLTTMLSGYASAGQLAIALACSITVASLTRARAACPGVPGGIGVGWVCLASVLVVGRFFGSLTTLHAVMLGVVPLVGWLAECRPFRFRAAWRRRLLVAALAVALLGTTVWQAWQRFQTNSGSPYGQDAASSSRSRNSTGERSTTPSPPGVDFRPRPGPTNANYA